MMSMRKIIKRIPAFILILFLAGLLHYFITDPEKAFNWLHSGNPEAIGRLFGMALGFGSMLILINFTIGFIVSLITRSVFSGSIVAIILGVIFGYTQTSNGILQMVTLGGGATLLILQIMGKLKIPLKK
jgi:hypothetical protein